MNKFEQKLAEHLRTGGGQMDLQPAQKLMHGLRGGRPHLRAVLTRPIGAAPRQEAHQDVHQGRVRHHLLRCALMATQAVVGGCKFKRSLFPFDTKEEGIWQPSCEARANRVQMSADESTVFHIRFCK